MKWLVVIHALSAIIGVGPVFFAHVLFRRNQSPQELGQSLKTMQRLEMFPKIGGTLAVLSGILLISLNDYGSFLQTWLIGALILYVLIQIIVIGLVAPRTKRLNAWLSESANKDVAELPVEQKRLHMATDRLFYASSVLAVILFIFMIAKPN